MEAIPRFALPGSTELILIAAVILIPLAIRLFSRSTRSKSVLGAVGMTCLICVGLVMLARFGMVNREEPQVATISNYQQPTDSVVWKESAGDSPASVLKSEKPNARTATESGSESTSSGVAGDPQLSEIAPGSHGPSYDGNVIWLPLSDKVIEQIISPEGAKALAELNKSLPPQVRQAYAAIPLSATGPGVAGPVVHGALISPVIRQALTSKPMQAFLAGFSQLVAVESGSEDGPHADAEAEEYVPPEWIENPGIGRIVVKSAFEPAATSPEESLRPAIVKALQNEVTKSSIRAFHTDGEWTDLIDVQVSDAAIEKFIIETDTRTEVVRTGNSDTVMKQTYALVEIPESAKQRVLSDVRHALKQDRSIALCVTLGSLWLGAVLLTVTIRASQNGSFVKRVATVPLLSLLVLPCLLLTIAMTAAMTQGKTFSFSLDGERVSCSIDVGNK